MERGLIANEIDGLRVGVIAFKYAFTTTEHVSVETVGHGTNFT